MGTRGIYGFIIGGAEKIGYNHFDSYPDGLGVSILQELRTGDLEEIKAQAGQLRVITDESKWPTPEQIDEVIAKLGTPDGSARDWYWLLRDTQGSLDRTLRSGYIIDYSDFALDSLFCEWGYLVNFETGFLEVYRGFQRERHEAGRFAMLPEEEAPEYYPIKMIAAYSLAELPDQETFLRDCSDSGET